MENLYSIELYCSEEYRQCEQAFWVVLCRFDGYSRNIGLTNKNPNIGAVPVQLLYLMIFSTSTIHESTSRFLTSDNLGREIISKIYYYRFGNRKGMGWCGLSGKMHCL